MEKSRTQDNPEAAVPPVEEERVAQRAYQRFEERGGEHGRDVEDWLEAERELRGSRGE